MTIRHRIWLPVLISLLVALPASAEAFDYTGQNPIRKLGRGVANCVTAPLELFFAIQDVGGREGPVAGIFVGTAYGVAAAFTREAVGLTEIVTFPAPLPNVGFGPIVEPEFMFDPDETRPIFGVTR